MTSMLAGIFFLSGAAGLVFETLWFRQAGLAFGNGFWASSIVLASFMLGLGLGNGLVARAGARIRAPLRVYAGLEVAIGLSGVALVVGLPGLTPALAAWLGPLRDAPWLLHSLQLACGFALLALPATAMGATLPLLVRVLSVQRGGFGAALGWLYGWNTLGAVAGCLSGEMILIERFGVRGAALCAALANGLAASAALLLARRLPAVPEDTTPAGTMPRRTGKRLLAAAALSGALLLALEVVWFRLLHLLSHAGAVAFAIMLAVVLTGIALGGLLAGGWLRRDPDAERFVPVLALLAGVLVVATYAGLQLALDARTHPVRDFAGIVTLAALLTLPGSLVSGVVFTLLGAAFARNVAEDTRAAGLVTLANTVGAALGSLVAGFALLPGLGIERSLAVLAVLYAGVALLAWRPVPRPAPVGARWALAAVLVAALVGFPHGLLGGDYLMRAVRSFPGVEEVLALREGRTETAILVQHEYLGEPEYLRLLTDGYSMTGDSVFARRYMKLYVYWAVALRPDPRDALLISYGVGSTASAMTETASLERIDVVDISREILDLSELVFPDPARNPLRDSRVSVHVEDGRHFLQTTARRYDLITGEPPPPKAAGVESLYTREYFQLVHDRLADGGITTYWLPLHSLSGDDARSILRGFCDVFVDCALWNGAGTNWMMTGSRGTLPPASDTAFSAQWRAPTVAASLREIGVESPAQLGATFIADASELRRVLAGALPLVDDFPKRLADGLFTEDGASHRFVAWGLDADARRARFAGSEWVARLWPEAIRAATLEEFRHEALITARFRGGWDAVEQLPAIHRVLHGTDLETLPVWLMGTTAMQLRIARSVAAREPGNGEAQRTLALGALARRAYAEAASRFAAVRDADPEDLDALYWQAYSLCAVGRCADGLALERAERGRPPGDSRGRLFWRFLRREFAQRDTTDGVAAASRRERVPERRAA